MAAVKSMLLAMATLHADVDINDKDGIDHNRMDTKKKREQGTGTNCVESSKRKSETSRQGNPRCNYASLAPLAFISEAPI